MGRQSSLTLDERLTYWELNVLCGGSSGPERHSLWQRPDMPRMLADICNPGTWEAELGETVALGYPGLHNERREEGAPGSFLILVLGPGLP